MLKRPMGCAPSSKRGVAVKESQWGYRVLVVEDLDGNQFFFPYPNEPWIPNGCVERNARPRRRASTSSPLTCGYCRGRVSQSSHVNPVRIRDLRLVPDRDATSPRTSSSFFCELQRLICRSRPSASSLELYCSA